MQEVYFVSGQAASGKTKFAKALAASRKLLILDLDDSLEWMIANNRSILNELGMENFLSYIGLERYKNLLERASAQFAQGKSLVIVAPFSKQIADETLWKEITQPFQDGGVSPKLIWVHIPNTLRATRIKSRGLKRDQGKLADMDSYLKEGASIAPVVSHIPIDGSADFTAQIKDNF